MLIIKSRVNNRYLKNSPKSFKKFPMREAIELRHVRFR